MAVANIVQEQGFADRWPAARGSEELRDLVLLSGRQRDAAPARKKPDSSDWTEEQPKQ